MQRDWLPRRSWLLHLCGHDARPRERSVADLLSGNGDQLSARWLPTLFLRGRVLPALRANAAALRRMPLSEDRRRARNG
jgi:hypothetical protein